MPVFLLVALVSFLAGLGVAGAAGYDGKFTTGSALVECGEVLRQNEVFPADAG